MTDGGCGCVGCGDRDAVIREQATKIKNLEIALASNRQLGAAVGIVMATEKITYEEAFKVLCVVSQRTQRKLGDVAADVMLTGVLERDVPEA